MASQLATVKVIELNYTRFGKPHATKQENLQAITHFQATSPHHNIIGTTSVKIIQSKKFWEHTGHHNSYGKNTLITSSFIAGKKIIITEEIIGPMNEEEQGKGELRHCKASLWISILL
nr:hypothetical protein CFP56_77060 [Quercus suber]